MGLFSRKQPEEVFWQWFAANSSCLLDATTGQEKVCDQLMAQLHRCNRNLCFALGTPQAGIRELVISAGGIRDAFPAVQRLVATAPDIPGWRWTAFRPRCGTEGTLRMGDSEVGANDVWFTANSEGPQVSLILYIRDLSQENSRTLLGIAFLLLDNALGEYDVATRIGHIDFQPLPEQPAALGLKPLSELPGIVDSLSAQTRN